MNTDFEIVIGLEVHCQLDTREKLFCGCPTTFGAAPNEQTCPICLGMPGTLPVLNAQAVELALRAGLALDCAPQLTSVFSRKHYFYPDLPKGYQITQYDQPIFGLGHLDIKVDNQPARRIAITRIHMEEDAGKSLHGGSGGTRIDLNRAGIPLIEIVSEPEMRSADEAVAYLRALHGVVRWVGVCDGNLEQGSFRCDANVSVRPRGQAELGTRTEIKNMNTFKGAHRAISYEAQRQIDVIKAGGSIVQETRLWDESASRTRSMRSKEDAHDYRYLPEPDLPPLRLEDTQISSIHRGLPELPQARRSRFKREYKLSEYDAAVLTSEREIAEYFEAALAIHRAPKVTCNWITSELLGRLEGSIGDAPVSPTDLAGLLARIDDGTISGKIAKTVFNAMMNGEGTADEIIKAKGLRQVTDASAIDAVCRDVLANNPAQVAQFRAGKIQLKGFFVGQVMKAMRGQASPQVVNQTLDTLLTLED